MAHLPIRLTRIYFSKQLQTNVLCVCLMNPIKENRITVFCTGNSNFCQNNLENTIFIVTGRPCGSVAQWSECSHGMREVLGSSPGRAMCFFLPCDIWWPVWVHARAASSIGTVSSVPAWFRVDSGMNLIKQGEIVTGRLCGSVAQWSECSHSMREVLGSSPGRAMCFFLPCDI